MKRMLAAGFISAIALVGSAGAASAAPADAACFGQVHKVVNVGELVKAEGGQGKNAIAKAACGG